MDQTILTALNEIGMQQSRPTQQTKDKSKMILYYISTHSNAVLRYCASDMFLHIDTDAAYLVTPSAKHRFEGYVYLGSNSTKTSP